jgi:hypothetical protein
MRTASSPLFEAPATKCRKAAPEQNEMSAITRGFINPFRNKARAVVVVALLSLVTGFLALMVQASLASRQQIAAMEGACAP